MHDELFDAEATRRVANRALVSAGLAVVGGCGGAAVPLSAVVVIPLLLIAIAVAISAIRTLVHPEAEVIGGARWVGVALAAFGGLAACGGLLFRVFLLLR